MRHPWLHRLDASRLALAVAVAGLSTSTGAPVFPRSINPSISTIAPPDSEEMALALSAAPTSLTVGAAVYVLRDGHFVKARDGSTGVACMVSRDPRASGVFPMCFDPEGARTLMREEMLKTKLWGRSLSDSVVKREVAAAYSQGTLHHPDKPAIVYMMSSHQILVTSAPEGPRRIGAWQPHVMIYLPHASADEFALGKESETGPVSVPFTDDGGVQMIVQVPHWADNPAPPDTTEAKRGQTG